MDHSLRGHNPSRQEGTLVWWEGEAAGQGPRTQGAQRDDGRCSASFLCFSFAFSLGPWNMGWGHPHLGKVYLLQLSLPRKTLKDGTEVCHL